MQKLEVVNFYPYELLIVYFCILENGEYDNSSRN